MLSTEKTEDTDNIINLVAGVMGAYSAAYFSYDAKSGDLRLSAGFSHSKNFNRGAVLKSGQGMLGWVVREKKSLVVKEFDRNTTDLKIYDKKENIKSLIAAPVIDGVRLTGVLCVDSRRANHFGTRDMKTLSEFAAALSRSGSRFKREQKLMSDAANIVSLDKIAHELASSKRISDMVRTLYRELGGLMEHSRFVFALKSPDEGEFHLIPEPSADDRDIKKIPLKLNESLIGWVIKKNRPLNHSDLSDNPGKHGLNAADHARQGHRSFLGVPMVVRKHVVGALAVLSTEKNAFLQREMRILSVLGAIAASHVAGAYVYGQSLASKKIDSLTGLGNYYHFQDKIKSNSLPGAVLMLDIINFSRITAQYSVDTADSALIEVAKFLKRIVGKEGFVTRYYGDVFLIFLPEHDREEAFLAAQKLLDIMKAKNFMINDKQVAFDGRIGIALYPKNGKNGSDLIKKSFSALKSAESRPGGINVAFYESRAPTRL
ncbi:MAG: GAF domain-containing protein [Nitrospinota bacterium]